MITPEMLREVLRYEPETGRLFWLERTPDMVAGKVSDPEAWCASWNSINAGRQAFTLTDTQGYKAGKVYGRRLPAHRVVWAVVHGEWPGQIDHINGDRTDNRMINLRNVSGAQNMKNKRLYARNVTGVSGVRRRGPRWEVTIGIGGRSEWLGSFSDMDEAIAVRRAAEARVGYHENHGRAV